MPEDKKIHYSGSHVDKEGLIIGDSHIYFNADMIQWFDPSEADADGYIYLDDESHADQVRATLARFAEAFDVEIRPAGPPVIGSFKQRLLVLFHRAKASDAAKQMQAELKRAIELRMVDGLQADVDLKQAQAASALLESLRDVQNAAIQLGSTLILKVDGAVMIRNLSPVEMNMIRMVPTILDTPADCLKVLQRASASPTELVELAQTFQLHRAFTQHQPSSPDE